MCDGTVISSGWETGYGYCVAIQDGDNRIWKYGHCSELRAAEGERVRLGEIVTRKHPVTKEIADSEKVIQILDQMKELELKYEGRNNDSGYQYLITLWNEEKLIRGISIQGNDYVVVDSERYEVNSLEGLLEVIRD